MGFDFEYGWGIVNGTRLATIRALTVTAREPMLEAERRPTAEPTRELVEQPLAAITATREARATTASSELAQNKIELLEARLKKVEQVLNEARWHVTFRARLERTRPSSPTRASEPSGRPRNSLGRLGRGLELAAQLTNAEILAGDDTSCRVLEVTGFSYGTVKPLKPGEPAFTVVSEIPKKDKGVEPFDGPKAALELIRAKKFGPWTIDGVASDMVFSGATTLARR